LFDRLADLVFVGEEVDDENEGVVVFDLLHRGLGGEGELEDPEFVELVGPGHRSSGIFRFAGQSEGLGASEVDVGVYLPPPDDAGSPLKRPDDFSRFADVLGGGRYGFLFLLLHGLFLLGRFLLLRRFFPLGSVFLLRRFLLLGRFLLRGFLLVLLRLGGLGLSRFLRLGGFGWFIC